MSVKTRNIGKVFSQTHTTRFKNLLVSGCSFTYNNSDSNICTWPYYLRDLAGFDNVYDVSQSGTGSNHIFNSVVYECETNPFVDPSNTLIIVMWSGLTRTDIIAEQSVTKDWHFMSNYCFDSKFATLSIFNQATDRTAIDELCKQYKKIVSPNAQIIESLIKVQALRHYLKSKGFNFVFLSWMDPEQELARVNTTLTMVTDPVPYLDGFARKHTLREPDGHPSPDGHLAWTRECLIPYLSAERLATDLKAV